MFEYVFTFQYGRCVKKKSDWFPKSTGINRLYYVKDGKVDITLDSTRYTLKKGGTYLLPQNLKFEPILTEKTCFDHMFFDFISFPIIKMDRMIEIDSSQNDILYKAGNILFDLMERHPLNQGADPDEYTQLIEGYLKNYLFLVDKQHDIGMMNDTRVRAALEYIHKNYFNNITLTDLMRVVNLEKNYLIRIFKQCMDVTPYQYIKKYRMNRALSMIKRNMSLSEVAIRVGYSDVAAFSHAFKNMYGIYPSEIV